METTVHPTGILAVEQRHVPRVLWRAKIMLAGLGDDPALFSAPIPPLPVFASQLALTEQVHVAVLARKATAAERAVPLRALWGMMRSELQYIQSVAEQGTAEQSVATLRAGGVEIALLPRHDKALLTVRQGPTSGSVILDAHARLLLGAHVKRYRLFGWQATSDGGQTFVTLPSTPTAQTTLSGLTPLTVYGFRVNVTTSTGIAGEWSQIIRFLVH
jgi:hypothetical protein